MHLRSPAGENKKLMVPMNKALPLVTHGEIQRVFHQVIFQKTAVRYRQMMQLITKLLYRKHKDHKWLYADGGTAY
jgi:hypothetical protein